MKNLAITGTARKELGKKAAKAERRANLIPCVLYGNGENTNFTVSEGELRKLIYTPDIYLVELSIDGKKANAVLKDAQFHPVKDTILHVDFYQVSEDKPIVMEVPIKLEGLAEGVKAGGKLNQAMRKMKVKGLYNNIPEILTVNIENLGLGKAIQVGSLSFDNLEIVSPKNAIVAVVKATRAAKNAAADK